MYSLFQDHQIYSSLYSVDFFRCFFLFEIMSTFASHSDYNKSSIMISVDLFSTFEITFKLVHLFLFYSDSFIYEEYIITWKKVEFIALAT